MILQHALKDLLLAAPVDRFNRFATLLGLEELSTINRDLTAFCTKPPYSKETAALIAWADSLIQRTAANPKVAPISKALSKAYKKGLSEFASAISLAQNAARKHVPPDTPDEDLAGSLALVREAAVSKVFDRPVKLETYSPLQENTFTSSETHLLSLVTQPLTQSFTALTALRTTQAIAAKARLFGLGLVFIETNPSVCPLCMQPLSEDVIAHIRASHEDCKTEGEGFKLLEQKRDEIKRLLDQLKVTAKQYHQDIVQQITDCLALEASVGQLEQLLGPQQRSHIEGLQSAITDLIKAKANADEISVRLVDNLDVALQRVNDNTEDGSLLELLGSTLVEFVAAGRELRHLVAKHSPGVAETARIVRQELDAVAGTQDISLLLEILRDEKKMRSAVRVAEILESLKGLKTQVDAYTTQTILNAVSGELTADVMDWYGRIRTAGDPDVHFAGFDMKKTSQGGRVQIKACSYGEDLVSAVSSLSESKLNALGLCISIATNLKKPSPFDFLIIDDPIQSWDRDHEVQFIDLITELVKRGKQVLLLSHNDQWIRQVRVRCASVNGISYEITGYTVDGPVIQEVPWVEARQRLQAISAILSDQSADSTRLQHAEEEIRQVIHQLTCQLYENVKGVKKSPNKLNAGNVRKLLLECGVEIDLVNKLVSAFATVDDAHHTPAGYAPNRQRILQYHGWATTLASLADQKPKKQQNAYASADGQGTTEIPPPSTLVAGTE